MSTFLWYPVTFTTNPPVWNATGSWTDPAFWALANSGFPPITGTLPADGDSALIVSMNTTATTPPLQPLPPYDSTVMLSDGTETVATLGLATVSIGVTATPATLDIEGATLVVNGAVEALVPDFPPPIVVPSIGGGTVELGSSATFEIGTTADSKISISFRDDTDDTLILDGPSASTPSAVTATISGFAGDNSIDLTSVPFAGATRSYDAATHKLTISGAAGPEAILTLPGAFTTENFTLVDDGSASVLVITCFARGTRILTPDGERPIEEMREGDLVITCVGEERRARPVRWIGCRRIDLRRRARGGQAQPVRICAGAFALNQPRRDLLVSPNHAVYAEGVLIPARQLVNGSTVSWAREIQEVAYLHLELDEHAILLAEGLPTESLVPGTDRSAFANSEGPVQLHPDFYGLAWEAEGCAPLVVTGPILAAVRARLTRRAAEIAAEDAAALCA